MTNIFSKINELLKYIFAKMGLFRSNRGIFAGVCQGISEKFNVNVTLIRLAFIFSTFFTLGFNIIIYLLCVIIMPKRSGNTPNSATKNYKNKDYIDVNSKEV